MQDVRRALVIGGGIGGLTAATALAQRGVEVVLFERRSMLDVPGVGLGQPANALRVYDAIGVLEQILDSGFCYDRMYIFGPKRDLIVDHKFLLGDDRLPAFCALSRLDLQNILLGAAQGAGVKLRLGVTVTAFAEEAGGVTVHFSDGAAERFDIVAGFDGVRSSTRLHLVGTAFGPRPSGYGAWRVQVPRPDVVRAMEFLQGIGSKTGAMPLGGNLMYLFHIRAEKPGDYFQGPACADLFRERLSQYGSYVADVAASLDATSDIVYSPIEPMMLPWPWFKGRVAIGGDAAHTFPPHLTQGAAMAAEDAYVLAREVTTGDGPMDARLMRYSKERYARCAFVYTFSYAWLADEQSIHSAAEFAERRAEMARNGSARIAASDRILNESIL